MAKIGFRYFKYAPFSGEEPADALPKYGPSMQIGKAISADISREYAEGELYADDGIAESDREFTKGSIAAVVDDIVEKVEAAIFGATANADNTGVTYGADDNPPFGGAVFIRVVKRNGVKGYEANYFPKVKATLGNDAAETKGSGFTYQTTALSLEYFAANDEKHTYRDKETFETEEEAKAWCDGKLASA